MEHIHREHLSGRGLITPILNQSRISHHAAESGSPQQTPYLGATLAMTNATAHEVRSAGDGL